MQKRSPAPLARVAGAHRRRRDGVSAGGTVIATKTLGLHMLGGRGDVAVLWNIRVSPRNGAGVSGPRCSGSSPVLAVAVPQSAGWTGVLARGPRGPGLTACPAGRISPAARARRRPAYGVDASFALFLRAQGHGGGIHAV